MSTYENIFAWIFGIIDLLERVYVILFKLFAAPVAALAILLRVCVMVENYSLDGLGGLLATFLIIIAAAAAYKAIINRAKLEQGRSRRRNAQ